MIAKTKIESVHKSTADKIKFAELWVAAKYYGEVRLRSTPPNMGAVKLKNWSSHASITFDTPVGTSLVARSKFDCRSEEEALEQALEKAELIVRNKICPRT